MGEHKCIDICPSGYYSKKNGLAPCYPCPKGTYQPQPAQNVCINCEFSRATASIASKDSGDCQGNLLFTVK